MTQPLPLCSSDLEICSGGACPRQVPTRLMKVDRLIGSTEAGFKGAVGPLGGRRGLPCFTSSPLAAAGGISQSSA